MRKIRIGRAVLSRRQAYPNNCNAAGVPLVGQTCEQTVKNLSKVVGAMTQEDRLAFEQACAQARYEAEQWHGENMSRTKASEGHREPAACPNPPTTAPENAKKAGMKRSRERLARVARFHIKVRYKDGLHLDLYIGPAWMGILISSVCAVGLPQLEPILRRLISAP
jgi:hypothetical protein